MNTRDQFFNQSDTITEACYKYNVVEKRCIYQIMHTLQSVKSANSSSQAIDKLIVTLTPEQLDACLGGQFNRSKVLKALQKLTKKTIRIEISSEVLEYTFLNRIVFDSKRYCYDVELTESLLPYLLEPSTGCTPINLLESLRFGSRYTQRIYELCCMFHHRGANQFIIGIEELRVMFELEHAYSRLHDFKKRVLETAQNELQELYTFGHVNIMFHFTEDKNLIDFQLTCTDSPEGMNITSSLESISAIIEKYLGRNKELSQTALSVFRDNPTLANEFYTLIKQKQILDYESDDISRLLRYLLAENFGIK